MGLGLRALELEGEQRGELARLAVGIRDDELDALDVEAADRMPRLNADLDALIRKPTGA